MEFDELFPLRSLVTNWTVSSSMIYPYSSPSRSALTSLSHAHQGSSIATGRTKVLSVFETAKKMNAKLMRHPTINGSSLNGDDELVWGPDAELTPLGISQAETAKAAWEAELSKGLRVPDSMYVSPHARAFNTWKITFSGNAQFKQSGPPSVMEACRERFGVHTCDRRRPKAFITSAFPEGVIEEGFTEEDELWTTDVRETTEQVAARVKTVIDHVFNHDPGNFISITSHSGMINGFLMAIGRPFYRLPTGGVLPVVVKGTVKT
ncbi:hypothetical protein ONZ45_g3422 [Pleurotus djamor]|nr:hypothetical protein ONZ45_g3422 [Pleurotus djamor]